MLLVSLIEQVEFSVLLTFCIFVCSHNVDAPAAVPGGDLGDQKVMGSRHFDDSRISRDFGSVAGLSIQFQQFCQHVRDTSAVVQTCLVFFTAH